MKGKFKKNISGKSSCCLHYTVEPNNKMPSLIEW